MEMRANGLKVFSRHYYIGENYQKKMIIKFCLLAVAGSAAFCTLFYWAMDRKLDGGYVQTLDGMRFVKLSVMRSAVYIDLIVIGVLIVAVLVLTLMMSHRIAGPTWRMEQSAKAVASGDLTLNVRLRKNDEMKPLADKMNRMVTGLKGKVDDMCRDYELLDEEIALLKGRWAACELTPELEHLRAGQDRLGDLRDLRRRHDEGGVRRRLLDRLQQRVERLR